MQNRPFSVLIPSAVLTFLLALGVASGCSGRIDTQCSVASDCSAGASCIQGACVRLPQCSRSGDCDAGSSCIAAACVPVGNPCSNNRDCAAGATCSSHSVCAPPSCTSAIDCGLEQICVQGSCAPVGTPLPPVPDGGFPPPPPDAGPTCVNLQCAQVACADGGTTTVMGSVFDPSGQVPLYNALVYVPNGEVKPFTQGVTCDRCGSTTTGDPLVIALTDATGSYTLKNVPAGTSFPLVMQIGKWRRQVTIPAVPACSVLTLTDPNQQRFPRNKSEGDIPQMAIATGSADPFECLLLKMGIDTSEFTRPDSTGRVHMYVTPQGSPPPLQLDGGSAPAASLWSDAGTLSRYDVVLLPCEGSEYRKPDAGIQNLVNYTSAGGRLFVTHYSYVWTAFNAPFNSVANWVPDAPQNHDPPDPFNGLIDTSFPKGLAFQDWLSNVGALDGGTLLIREPRDDVGPVNLDGGTRWVYGPNPNNTTTPVTTQHLTWNTPIFPPPQADGDAGVECGRVVFSDFHVTAAGLLNNKGQFPSSCASGALTPQEKALIFMLFDVSSCVQDDHKPPEVCPGLGQSCSPTQPCCGGLTCLGQSLAACVGGEPCSCTVPIN